MKIITQNIHVSQDDICQRIREYVNHVYVDLIVNDEHLLRNQYLNEFLHVEIENLVKKNQVVVKVVQNENFQH